MEEKTGRTDVQDFSEISWLNYGRIFMKTEMEMKVLALKISKGYVEKLVVDRDEKRPAEECEHNAIYAAAFGALQAYNGISVKNQHTRQAILDAAENILSNMLPRCNTYETLYIPLNEILKKWEKKQNS